MDKQLFIEELRKHNIVLSERQIEQFETYITVLIEENAKYNLTSITNIDDIYEKHFYDSLSLLWTTNLSGSIVDVGSGGGFPAIPLKIVRPDLDISVLDATNKKIVFIDLLCTRLGLNVTGICARAEEYRSKKFDYVIARGVASLNILLELCSNLVKNNGCLVAMKGAKYSEELNQSNNAMTTLNYSLLNKFEYVLPNEESKRCNLVFTKIGNHQLKYPRNYAKIKKNPL